MLNDSTREYLHQELRQLCNDLKVDQSTRKIAYGLFKTNHKAASDYVRGYPIRLAVMNQVK